MLLRTQHVGLSVRGTLLRKSIVNTHQRGARMPLRHIGHSQTQNQSTTALLMTKYVSRYFSLATSNSTVSANIGRRMDRGIIQSKSGGGKRLKRPAPPKDSKGKRV